MWIAVVMGLTIMVAAAGMVFMVLSGRPSPKTAAEDPHTSARRLIALAKNPDDMGVLQRVADNPNAPEKALRMLARSKSVLARASVAEHQNAPVDVLMTLAADELWSTRMYAARNPRTPIEAVGPLLADENREVRWSAREHAEEWVHAHFGIDPSNAGAINDLLSQGEWWTLTPESDAVLLAKALHPEPLTIGAS